MATTTYHFSIVGSSHYKGAGNAIARLKPGQRLDLIREPTNPYDKNAVAVYLGNAQKLGHVPRDVAAKLAPRLDRGDAVACRVRSYSAVEATVAISLAGRVTIGHSQENANLVPMWPEEELNPLLDNQEAGRRLRPVLCYQEGPHCDWRTSACGLIDTCRRCGAERA